MIERIKRIQTAACEFYGVPLSMVLGPGKSMTVVKARHVAMFLSRNVPGSTFERLAAAFERRDHATILYACRSIRDQVSYDRQLAQEVEAVRLNAGETIPA